MLRLLRLTSLTLCFTVAYTAHADAPFSPMPWATAYAVKQQLHWSGMHGMFWRNTQLFGTLLLLNR